MMQHSPGGKPRLPINACIPCDCIIADMVVCRPCIIVGSAMIPGNCGGRAIETPSTPSSGTAAAVAVAAAAGKGREGGRVGFRWVAAATHLLRHLSHRFPELLANADTDLVELDLTPAAASHRGHIALHMQRDRTRRMS